MTETLVQASTSSDADRSADYRMTFEPCPHRLRVIVNGETIADSIRNGEHVVFTRNQGHFGKLKGIAIPNSSFGNGENLFSRVGVESAGSRLRDPQTGRAD